MELFNKIKQLRLEKSLSQKEMADKLNVAISTYQYYERGERIPPADFITLIITSFGVNPSWLLTDEGEMYRQTGDVRAEPGSVVEKILLVLKDMPEDDQREILKRIEEKKLISELLREKKGKSSTG